MALTHDELDRRHKYHRPRHQDDLIDHSTVRGEIEYTARRLDVLLEGATDGKAGREIALFHTKLEEASFWAHAALARSRA